MGSKPCAQVARARNVGGNRRFRIGCALQKQPEIPIDCCGEVAASEPGGPVRWLPRGAGVPNTRKRRVAPFFCALVKPCDCLLQASVTAEGSFPCLGQDHPYLRGSEWHRAFPSPPAYSHGGCARWVDGLPPAATSQRAWHRRPVIRRRGKLRDQRGAVSEHPLLRESGPSARPMNPDWARELRDQCLDQDVALFFKRWGGPPGGVLDGKIWAGFPRSKNNGR
jgi:hypothetical protein